MKIKVIFFIVLVIVILVLSVSRVLISMDPKKQNIEEKWGTGQVNPSNNSQTITDDSNVGTYNTLWKAVERKESYNNELQYYCAENVTIKDKELIIISKKEQRENKEYTSGLIESNYAYLYGYFEFEIRVSKGRGLFPAIWLMPDDNTGLPEIDVFEMIGSAPEHFSGVLHYLDDKGQKQRSYFEKRVEKKDMYKIALNWNEKEITWYIDGEPVHRIVKGIPHKHMYIIINQAIGGNWPGEPDEKTLFPASFIIKVLKMAPVNERRRY